ncbi:MAG: hypothetical protein WEB87_02905 [Bacteriovoracaceae bacterium]
MATNLLATKDPLVFNVFKPANISSFDVIRVFKKSFGKSLGKIGHFGTLDPFACGVLLIGTGGAARLNDYVHELMPKTYLAVGKLGQETDTGDFTAPVTQRDESSYLEQTISKMTPAFIEEQLKSKFLGSYMQAPHKYSAAKHEGKKLLEWAREGVEIKKEPKERFISSLEVVKYEFPYLSIRFTVSSGTYIRTLFSECANHLGTIGSLVSLVRERIGHISSQTSLMKKDWPKDGHWDYRAAALSVGETLPLPKVFFEEKEAKLLSNGVALRKERAKSQDLADSNLFWAYDEEENLLALTRLTDGEWKVQVNFS